MTITVNSEPRPLDPGTTIASLLESLGLPATDTVAEINGDIIPRARFADTPLNDGDRIELIRFVGGG